MSLQDDLAAAQNVANSADAALQDARDQVSKIQSLIDIAAPKLSIVAKFEAEIANVSSDVADRLRLAVSDLKTLFEV